MTGCHCLQVRDLTTRFARTAERSPPSTAFRSTSRPGRSLAIVGESGSGKSVTALSILRLIPSPPGRIERGEVLFDGTDLLKLDDPGIRAIRGDQIAMIFQEPMSSLNPSLTIGMQVGEPVQSASQGALAGGARQGAGTARPRAHSRCRAPAAALIRISSPAGCGSAP